MTYWFQRKNMWNAKYVWSENKEWIDRSLESCKGVDGIYEDWLELGKFTDAVFARPDADQFVAQKWLDNKQRILELNT
jgi:hypothetical protein